MARCHLSGETLPLLGVEHVRNKDAGFPQENALAKSRSGGGKIRSITPDAVDQRGVHPDSANSGAVSVVGRMKRGAKVGRKGWLAPTDQGDETDMPLPLRAFYTVQEAARRWECSLGDLAGWAAIGKLEIVTAIRPVIQGGHVHAGFVVVPVADIMGLFSSGLGGPETASLRRIRPVDTEEWILIETPADFVQFTSAA